MKRKCGFEAEYKRRHDLIWPELKNLTLFAFQRLEDDFEEAQIHAHPIVKKWRTIMADVMGTNADHSPVMGQLTEVLHMD